MIRTKLTTTSGIYQLKSKINGKIYIGSAVNLLKRIKKSHFEQLRNNRHANKHLQNHVNKHGLHNIYFGILELCDKKDLLKREQFWIDYFTSTI